MEQSRGTAFMDWCAKIWSALGRKFGLRPATIIGITVGAIIFASGLTYLLVKQDSVEDQVAGITSAFCNGSAPRTPTVETNCRKLLDQLLLNPTPGQKARIRQIATEGN